MAPRLSYVVLVDAWPTIAEVAGHLTAQTAASEIELVLVCPSRAALALPEAGLDPLAGVQVVEHPLLPMGDARAAGVAAARGEVVAIGETHSFPEPGWAQALLAAHDRGWSAVAPCIGNGNPDGALSWVGLAMDYGRWMAPRTAEIPVVPSYNAAYSRELLLGLGERLPALLAPGPELSQRLRREGHRLGRDAEVRVDHLNVSRPGHWLLERYLGGRLVGGARSTAWPRARRAAYVLGSPLIAPLLVRRTLRATRGVDGRPPRALGALWIGALAWAAGEAAGYAMGVGGAERRMLAYELHKRRYVAGGRA